MNEYIKESNIVCVCGGVGFPSGTASTKRIMLIGRALQSSGVQFSVLHIGPSGYNGNSDKSGESSGVHFLYLSHQVKPSERKIARLVNYFYGCLLLPFVLARLDKKPVVYIYYQGCLINLWTLFVCKFLKLKVVQEACEWWPETEYKTRFNTWLYNRIMFRWSNGAIAISNHIEDLIKTVSKRGYPIVRIPVLVDPCEADCAGGNFLKNASGKNLLWCGSLYGYQRDVKFIFDALIILWREKKLRVTVSLCGPTGLSAEQELMDYAGEIGLPQDQIEITGFVSDNELWQRCQSAGALLMPMWNDARSTTRFPTKIGQYVASGRPIIAAPIGEVANFLKRDRTAVFYEPGNAGDFALAIERTLLNESFGNQVAQNAKCEVLPKLDYREYGPLLKKWIEDEIAG